MLPYCLTLIQKDVGCTYLIILCYLRKNVFDYMNSFGINHNKNEDTREGAAHATILFKSNLFSISILNHNMNPCCGCP